MRDLIGRDFASNPKVAALTAATGIAGVVGVLVGVLASAEGFRQAMTVSGAPDVAIVLRTGADSEMTSGLDRESVRTIADAPGVARNDSAPVTSAELFVIIHLPKRSTGTDANVPLRGVGQGAFDVRGNIEMVDGRRFETGKNEVIVGAGRVGPARLGHYFRDRDRDRRRHVPGDTGGEAFDRDGAEGIVISWPCGPAARQVPPIAFAWHRR